MHCVDEGAHEGLPSLHLRTETSSDGSFPADYPRVAPVYPAKASHREPAVTMTPSRAHATTMSNRPEFDSRHHQ